MFKIPDRPEIKSATVETVEDGPFRDFWDKPVGPSRKVGLKTKNDKKKRGVKKKL